MYPEQFNRIVGLLSDIRDRLPAPSAKDEVVKPPKASDLAAAKRAALQAVYESLDGWIEAAQENHSASQHRGENRGEECWRLFSPGDIRNMINDAACELGLAEFPYPSVPKEDLK